MFYPNAPDDLENFSTKPFGAFGWIRRLGLCYKYENFSHRRGGSHLCEKLLAQNNEVVCLDNLFTGSKKNIAHLFDNKNFALVEHDVERSYEFAVDQIYNLACPAAPVWYQKDPVKTPTIKARSR